MNQTLSGNIIKCPHPQSKMKSMGLTGRFIYLEIQACPEKPFTIHLDFKIKGRNNLRISFSNLFKQVKSPTQFVYQIPLYLENKWTLISLDVLKTLEISELFPSNFKLEECHIFKGFTLSASMNFRGIFTSDNLYQWHNLPHEMTFKAPAGENKSEWDQKFQWTFIPCLDKDLAEDHNEKIQCIKGLESDQLDQDIKNILQRTDDDKESLFSDEMRNESSQR